MITHDTIKTLMTGSVDDIKSLDPRIFEFVMAILPQVEQTNSGVVVIGMALLIGSVLSDLVLTSPTDASIEDHLAILGTMIRQSYTETMEAALQTDAYGKRH